MFFSSNEIDNNEGINEYSKSKNFIKYKITKAQKYDQIYSDFNELPRENNKKINAYEYSFPPSQRTTKTETKPLQSRVHTKSGNYQIKTQEKIKPPIKEHTRKKTSVDQRLYNYGYYIKNKHEKIKQQNEKDLLEKMSPFILLRSKKMKRNSSDFQERLYNNPNKTPKRYDKIYHKSPAISKDNSLLNTSSHKPTLNKKSLEIANRLEPSKERLIRKKKNYSISAKSSCYSFDNNYSYLNTSKSLSTSTSKKCNEMYEKGLNQINQRQKNYNENIINKENEYKKYSFKPEINIKKNNKLTTCDKNKEKDNNSYNMQKNWKMRIEKQNMQKKKKIDDEEMKKCTFAPSINHLEIKNDEKFILNHLSQMNDYVNRRREAIQKQKDYEDYKQKKLGGVKDYQMKITQPREFSFETSKRSVSRSKSKEKKQNMNEYQDNFTKNIYFSSRNKINYNNHDLVESINILHEKIQNLEL